MLILSSDDQLNDPVAVNQRIMMYLFMSCQSCDQLVNTCTIIEELADPAQQLNVNNFQRGKTCSYTFYVCTYLCVSVMYDIHTYVYITVVVNCIRFFQAEELILMRLKHSVLHMCVVTLKGIRVYV